MEEPGIHSFSSRGKPFNAFYYLILLGLFVRILYWFEHTNSPFFAVPLLDQQCYDLCARMLVRGEPLGIFAGFRPVLYPFFLSLIYRLGGVFSIELSIVVQHLLGVATSVMVALIAARLFRDHSAGFLSGILYALAGPPLFFEGELLITSFLAFLVSVTLYVHALACRNSWRFRPAAWLICGAMTALAAQARANMLIFFGVYPLFALHIFVKSRRRAALIPLYGVVGALCVMIIFGIVNIKQSGRFQLIPSGGGVNFYLGNKLTADGMIPRQERFTTYGETYRDSIETFARQGYHEAMLAGNRKPVDDPSAISRYWTHRAFEDILSDPMRWLRLMGKKIWLVFWNAEISNNKTFSFITKEESMLLRFLPVRWFVLLALAPIGVLTAQKRGDRHILFIILSFLFFYAAGIVLFFVNSRYRIPLWPAMAILAGGGLKTLWSSLWERERRYMLKYLSIAIGISLVSLVNWPGIELRSYARDYFFRSITHYQRNQYAEALDDIKQSLRLDPRDTNALLHYGNVLFALKKYDKAKKVYLRTSARDWREPRVWNNLGAACEVTKDYKNAYRAYLNALALNKNNKTALQNLILLELRAGLTQKAAETIAQLESMERDNVVAISAKSFLESMQGRSAEAKILEKRAYELDPSTAGWVFGMLNRDPIDIK